MQFGRSPASNTWYHHQMEFFLISKKSGDVQLDTVQLDTSHSQRLNIGKSPGTGRCEWLWVIALCPNEPLPKEEII